MPRIDYDSQDFDSSLGAQFQGKNSFYCTWDEIVRSAITVGRSNWGNVIRFGFYSVVEIIYRAAIVLANLKELPDGRFAKSPAYRGLDPSEKSAISYFLGLAVAKLFAERLLQVPWLMHLDVYRGRFNVQVLGDSRPDLFGRDARQEWYVVESKGRSGRINSADKAKARDQARRLVSIMSKAPRLQLGLITFFDAKDGLRLFAKDPPNEEASPQDLRLDTLEPGEFMLDYYRLIVDFLKSDYGSRNAEVAKGIDCQVKYIQEIDLTLGVVTSLFQALQSHKNRGELESVPGMLSDILHNVDYHDSENFVGRDGVFVQLGPRWSNRLDE